MHTYYSRMRAPCQYFQCIFLWNSTIEYTVNNNLLLELHHWKTKINFANVPHFQSAWYSPFNSACYFTPKFAKKTRMSIIKFIFQNHKIDEKLKTATTIYCGKEDGKRERVGQGSWREFHECKEGSSTNCSSTNFSPVGMRTDVLLFRYWYNLQDLPHRHYLWSQKRKKKLALSSLSKNTVMRFANHDVIQTILSGK